MEIYLESDILMLAEFLRTFVIIVSSITILTLLILFLLLLYLIMQCFFFTDVVIEPYPSIEIYKMIQHTKHGGFSQVTTRYVRGREFKVEDYQGLFQRP